MTEQISFLDDAYPAYRPKKQSNPLFDSSSCEWETPQELFDRLDGDPQDGEAELDVHYDPDNPALIAAEGMAIGDKIVGQD